MRRLEDGPSNGHQLGPISVAVFVGEHSLGGDEIDAVQLREALRFFAEELLGSLCRERS